MPTPVQALPGASAIPPNSDLQALIQASVASAGTAPPIQQSAPMNQTIPGVQSNVTMQGPVHGQAPGPSPVSSAPPARNSQQDWFAQMGTGDDPDASEDFQLPQQQPRPQDAWSRPPPQQVQAQPQPHAIPELNEIDALLAGVPQQGAPQEQPQQQVQGQQPQVQPQAAAPPQQLDPQEMQRRAIDELMGREYAIPEADARRLISEPEAVLPRLAATVHVNAVRDFGRIAQQMLPQMIQNVVAGEIRAMRAESTFFSRYPQLAKPEFRPFVEKGISFARQQNPSATSEQLMAEGATYSAMLIKRSYRPSVQAQPQGRAPVAPHVPAASFGGMPVPQNPNGGQSDNIFTQFANDPNLFDF